MKRKTSKIMAFIMFLIMCLSNISPIMAANTTINLPKDPMILLSVINTKIRDQYHTLDALCEYKKIEKNDIIEILKGIDYEYDESRHQFV